MAAEVTFLLMHLRGLTEHDALMLSPERRRTYISHVRKMLPPPRKPRGS